jgi:hypothetical protein
MKGERPPKEPLDQTPETLAQSSVNELAPIPNEAWPESWNPFAAREDSRALATSRVENHRSRTTSSSSSACGSSTTVSTLEAPSTMALPSTVAVWLKGLPISTWEVAKAAQLAGRKLPLKKPEFLVWKVRLAIESGHAEPAPVDTVALPVGCNGTVEAVWNGFVLLLACRGHIEGPEKPAPFACNFAAAWSGVTLWQARAARHELRRMGYMIAEGKYGGRTTLWRPREPD